MKFEIEQSKVWTSFHVLRRVIPHCGPKFEYSGFMDDFGDHVELNFRKFEITVADGDF